MPIFVTLAKSTAESTKSMVDLDKTYEEGMKISEQMGIKHVAAYGVLGPYDMMFIYEAPNEKAAAGLVLSFSPRGDAQTETWTAIPMEEFKQLASKLKG